MRSRGWLPNFSSINAKTLDTMNLKNWSNYCFFFCSSKDCGIRVQKRTCVFSGCGCSISETITHVSACSVVSPNRNLVDECRLFTNSCKLDFCFQCLDVLLNFSQTVSSCGLFIPWRHYHRNYFFWLDFLQYVYIQIIIIHISFSEALHQASDQTLHTSL